MKYGAGDLGLETVGRHRVVALDSEGRSPR